MNQQAGRSHLRFYELLLMLIDEQDSVETLNQWIEKDKYEGMQQRIIGFTAEYDCGTRTKEQLSRAVAYSILEQGVRTDMLVTKFSKFIRVAWDVKVRSEPGKADNVESFLDFVQVQTEVQVI
ncbi:hypothetical protein T10_4783 [Trichinella papuae]|uniref:Uncharacterized protein n=1 Tax=Trichinella papuae TaxID=268474 RepID=A0A0V1M5A6_9BILA|nr:hypothetical protein T10_4783 [Trichinella papuae]